MLSNLPVETASSGTLLLRRAMPPDAALYIDRGQVALGVMGLSPMGTLERQLCTVEGPCWLEASASILNVPSAVDAVTETDVQLRRMPLEQFRTYLAESAPEVLSLLNDIARANQQQTELTVRRMSKDAEFRCAEWLLSHAQTNSRCDQVVHLEQYKRSIATQLGIVPETLSRALRRLRDMGLVSGQGKTLTLPHPARLQALAGSPPPGRKQAAAQALRDGARLQACCAMSSARKRNSGSLTSQTKMNSSAAVSSCNLSKPARTVCGPPITAMPRNSAMAWRSRSDSESA